MARTSISGSTAAPHSVVGFQATGQDERPRASASGAASAKGLLAALLRGPPPLPASQMSSSTSYDSSDEDALSEGALEDEGQDAEMDEACRCGALSPAPLGPKASPGGAARPALTRGMDLSGPASTSPDARRASRVAQPVAKEKGFSSRSQPRFRRRVRASETAAGTGPAGCSRLHQAPAKRVCAGQPRRLMKAGASLVPPCAARTRSDELQSVCSQSQPLPIPPAP
jgi:hypothetical protein